MRRAQAENQKHKSFPDRLAPFSPYATAFAALIAALIAALAAIWNSGLNYRATLSSQRTTELFQQDSQFYEALKRFGDIESPSGRAVAAGLIARMVTHYDEKRDAKTNSDQKGDFRRRDYFPTVFDQLMAGLRLEHDPVVVEAMSNALRSLASRDKRGSLILESLIAANYKLQREFMESVTWMLALDGFSSTEDPKPSDWEIVAAASDFDVDALSALTRNFGSRYATFLHSNKPFYVMLQRAKTKRQSFILTREEKARLTGSARVTLAEDARRLRSNIKALGAVLPEVGLKQVRGSHLFLYGLEADWFWAASTDLNGLIAPYADIIGNFEQAELRYCELHGATIRGNLKQANLSESHLQGADLSLARLEMANLKDCDLRSALLPREGSKLAGTRLYGAVFDEDTDFGGWKEDWRLVAWASANFYLTDEETTDDELVSKLTQSVNARLTELDQHARRVEAAFNKIEPERIVREHISETIADARESRHQVMKSLRAAHPSVRAVIERDFPDWIADRSEGL